MVKRLYLVRHAPTHATRAAAFPQDEQLDAAAIEAARALRHALPQHFSALVSPRQRCQQTAVAAGLDPAVDEQTAECDFGLWGGKTLQDVYEADPVAASRWMQEPDFAPPQGESMNQLLARAGGWLDSLREASVEGDNQTTVAVTHGGFIKAALVKVLGAPTTAFWQLDIAPLSITELHTHGSNWSVTRVNDKQVTGGKNIGKVGGP